jgi:hypothetical protein
MVRLRIADKRWASTAVSSETGRWRRPSTSVTAILISAAPDPIRMSSRTRRLQNHAVPYTAWREARPAFKRAFDGQLAVFLAASIRYGNSTRAADRPCEQKGHRAGRNGQYGRRDRLVVRRRARVPGRSSRAYSQLSRKINLRSNHHDVHRRICGGRTNQEPRGL